VLAEEPRDRARHDAILQAVAFAASAFLRAPEFEESIPTVLRRIGEGADVGRVYVFEMRWARDRRLSSLRYEWVAEGVRARIADAEMRNVPLGEIGFGRWEALLAVGEAVHGAVSSLPPAEWRFLAAQGVRSVLAVPLFVEGEWWGYMGFEDYRVEQEWTVETRDALRLAADLFGGMLTRRELDARVTALVEAAAEGILIHDGRTLVDINPNLLRMLGYGCDELLGTDPFLLLAPESRDTARAHSRRDDRESYEAHMQRKDGTSLPVELRGKMIRYRGRMVRIVTVRDVTAQKAAEESQRALLREHAAREAAEAAERRAEFLAEASRILNSSLDYDTSLARFARLAVPFLGDYSIIDIVVGGQIRRVATAHADPEREHLAKALEAYPPTWTTNPIVQAYGTGCSVRAGPEELRPEAISANPEHQAILQQLAPHSGLFAPMHGPDGVLGVVSFVSCDPRRVYSSDDMAFAEDLANRAALAISNAKLFHEAQEFARERDEVLAVVAHDLRNPLNTVGVAASMLLERVGNAAGAKYVGMIQNATARMNRLIQDLLEITRIERGRFSLEKGPLQAAPLLNEAVIMLRPIAEARQIRLEAEGVVEGTRVLADGSRVLQVLSNLVGNAVKFTPDGGSVRIACTADGESARFSVTDTGPGIPPEQIPQLFGRFWQADSADRRGVGLGLSIAKGIVEAHGGTIWVDSRVGEGSTFHFTLPLVAREAATAASVAG
jgi:PAS domain S-box-containing protein